MSRKYLFRMQLALVAVILFCIVIVNCLLWGFEWPRTNDVGGRESLELFFSLESVSSSMRASKVIEYTCLNMYIRFTTGLINISFSNYYIPVNKSITRITYWHCSPTVQTTRQAVHASRSNARFSKPTCIGQ